MKRLKQIIITSCVAVLVALSGAGAARACMSTWYASDGANAAICSLTKETSTTCFYSCRCTGTCSGIYKFFGFREI